MTYTIESAHRIHSEWNVLKDFIDDQLTAAGYDQTFSSIHLDGDSVEFEDYHGSEYTVLLESLLTSTREELKEVKRQQDERDAEARRIRDKESRERWAAQELARAREIVARYENRHPDEDIEN